MPVSKNASSQLISQRIKELQIKIQDEKYISYAVERIALIVSRQLIEKRNGNRSPEKLY